MPKLHIAFTAPSFRPTTARAAVPFTVWVALLALVCLLVRLPLCWDAAAVRNDGAEYLAIARSLRQTARYATDLKYHFWNDDPVRHAAWGDRPPLYPAVALLWQRVLPLSDPTAAARVGNALLAALASAAACFYLRRLHGERAALLAAGFTFLLPHALYWTAQPMTEALWLLLGFCCLGAWETARTARTGAAGALRASAGVLAGLAYLARPTGSLLLAACLIDAFLSRRERPLRGIVPPLLLGFLLCAAPYHLLLWRLYGSPLHSALGYTFAVAEYYEVTYHGFERQFPGAAAFLLSRGGEVPPLLLRQLGAHAESLLVPLIGLLPLVFRLRRAALAPPYRAGWILAGLTVVAHTLVWSAWGSSRYFLLVLPLLAASLLAAAPPPGAGRKLLLAANGLGLAAALAGFYGRELGAPAPGARAARAAAAAVSEARLVASDRPATFNLLLERPAVMLPRTTDPAQLGRFVARYRPDTLVLFLSEPLRDEAEVMARSWRAGGLPPGWKLRIDTADYLIAAERDGGSIPGAGPELKSTGTQTLRPATVGRHLRRPHGQRHALRRSPQSNIERD